jgi:hypothetical protein
LEPYRVKRDRRRGREVVLPALLADMEMRVGAIQSKRETEEEEGR